MNGPIIPAPRSMAEQPRPKAIADLTLAATSTAVNVGNLFLCYTFAEWRRTELIDTGEAVLSEMIGQTVELTGVPDPAARWINLRDLALLRVRLVLLEAGVIVEVADRHNQPPTWPDAVTSLCSRWSSYPTNVGRVVWCELEARVYELTEQGLPKRPKTAGATGPPAPGADPELLRRVLEGLEGL
ncbi:hypothetical protein [Amycolatopsis sp. NPDC051128]|uniref:hypothetical protein n=1 Tax=Amycolatopsis sp. NPDC051128 TaxID=3155412 RepID=UPI003427C54E